MIAIGPKRFFGIGSPYENLVFIYVFITDVRVPHWIFTSFLTLDHEQSLSSSLLASWF
jgi:hypothetical protein